MYQKQADFLMESIFKKKNKTTYNLIKTLQVTVECYKVTNTVKTIKTQCVSRQAFYLF